MPAEFSCGGVAVDGRKVLLVRVDNLKNRKVWTFPKGHVECGETPRAAALREVLEETGYRCKILRPLLRVRYCFMMNRVLIRKAVQWYLMSAVSRAGKPDFAEIEDVMWVSPEKASLLVHYPSDKKLVQMVSALCGWTIRQPEQTNSCG
ncbi:MAG: NUDIX hydrolase [Elusimicrobiales bacterium]